MVTKRDQSGLKFGHKLNDIFATLLRVSRPFRQRKKIILFLILTSGLTFDNKHVQKYKSRNTNYLGTLYQFWFQLIAKIIGIFHDYNFFVATKRVLHNGISCIQVTGSLTRDLLLASCRFIILHILLHMTMFAKFVFRYALYSKKRLILILSSSILFHLTKRIIYLYFLWTGLSYYKL